MGKGWPMNCEGRCVVLFSPWVIWISSYSSPNVPIANLVLTTSPREHLPLLHISAFQLRETMNRCTEIISKYRIGYMGALCYAERGLMDAYVSRTVICSPLQWYLLKHHWDNLVMVWLSGSKLCVILHSSISHSIHAPKKLGGSYRRISGYPLRSKACSVYALM